MSAKPWVVSDELWRRIEPLLPRVERRFRYPGRRRLPDRQALQGILFVLHTGIAWRHLPLELGFRWRLDVLSPLGRVAASGSVAAAARTAAFRAASRRRDRMGAGGRRLQSRTSEKGGAATGPSPVDRARNGSKHHLARPTASSAASSSFRCSSSRFCATIRRSRRLTTAKTATPTTVNPSRTNSSGKRWRPTKTVCASVHSTVKKTTGRMIASSFRRGSVTASRIST